MSHRTEGHIDLSITASKHGGYVVFDSASFNGREILFAGELDACLCFMGLALAKHTGGPHDASGQGQG